MRPAPKEGGRASPFQGPIWEGVYDGFDEVPKIGDGFAGGAWSSAMLEKGRLATTGSSGTGESAPMYSTSLLPLVVTFCEPRAGAVRILDFGGGVGTTFAAVTQSAQLQRLDYDVIEMPNVCDIGSRMFKDDPRIRFQSTLPADITTVDIVHFGSSIQYVKDWKELLQRVAQYQPQIMLFTELMAGDIPTFATAQNYYGSTIPAWFFNFREFTDHLGRLGFRLAFKAPYGGTYLGKVQPCPQPNFAPEYRLGYASHALFRADPSISEHRTPV